MTKQIPTDTRQRVWISRIQTTLVQLAKDLEEFIKIERSGLRWPNGGHGRFLSRNDVVAVKECLQCLGLVVDANHFARCYTSLSGWLSVTWLLGPELADKESDKDQDRRKSAVADAHELVKLIHRILSTIAGIESTKQQPAQKWSPKHRRGPEKAKMPDDIKKALTFWPTFVDSTKPKRPTCNGFANWLKREKSMDVGSSDISKWKKIVRGRIYRERRNVRP